MTTSAIASSGGAATATLTGSGSGSFSPPMIRFSTVMSASGTISAKMTTDLSRNRCRRSDAAMVTSCRISVPQGLTGQVQEDRFEIGSGDFDVAECHAGGAGTGDHFGNLGGSVVHRDQ